MNLYEQHKQIIIPQKLLTDYETLGLNNDDLVNVIKLLMQNTQQINISTLNQTTQISRNALSKLVDLKLIDLTELNNSIYIDMQPLFKRLYENKIVVEKTNQILDSAQLDRFNFLLRRNLKAFEIQKLNDWINEGFTTNEIEIAMQKSIVNNVDNFNYIYAVLKNKDSEQKTNPQVVTKNFDLF